MPPTGRSEDPRSVITPEAFQVSEELLGRRLATPRRRLLAIWIDLFFIAILAAVTSSFALVLGVLASLLFIRAGFAKTPVRGRVLDYAMRGSVIFLGLFIGLVTAALWFSAGLTESDDRPTLVLDFGDEPPSGSSELSPLAVGPSDAVELPELELYSDTLDALAERIEELEQDVENSRRRAQRARDELEASNRDRGLTGLLRDLLDELGFGFGWASLYMTVLLTVWNGRTMGKRLLGIRVLRLDGQPITWWVAFERVGGYAAGFATGLLGFAQIYWDANRQAIHDRIVGTVVVRDEGRRAPEGEASP